MSEFAETYIKHWAKPRKKSWEEDQRILSSDVLPIIGTLKLDKVTKRHINALLDRKLDAGAPVAHNRLLALLSKFFNFAIPRGEIKDNPTSKISKEKETRRPRVLTDDEIRLLFNTPAEAAEALGVTQSRISGLYRGKIDKFTIDMPKKITFAETTETDNRPREIQLMINLIQPDPQYQPLFLSDEACFLDITSDSREVIEAKLRAYFQGDLPAPITTPLWQFIEIAKRRYPGWTDEIHH